MRMLCRNSQQWRLLGKARSELEPDAKVMSTITGGELSLFATWCSNDLDEL